MEIAVFLAMMIVPFLSVAALIISVFAIKKANALKDLCMKILDRGKGHEERLLKDEFNLRVI